MYVLSKFVDHRCYRNADISSYMNTLKKAELSASVRQTGWFWVSGIPIYNSEVPDRLEENWEKEDEEEQHMQ